MDANPDAVRTSDAGQSRQKLIELLAGLGARAFALAGPDLAARQQLTNLLNRTPPVALLPALNVLIQPGRVPAWLQAELTSTLALLPLRDDGVRATLEFVFSVRGGGTAASEGSKEGASITHEAVQAAAQLLANPPARATPESWFAGLAPQLMHLLDGDDGLELAKVAAYVVGFGILGRRRWGAPGALGWRYLAAPILNGIDPTTATEVDAKTDDSKMVDIVNFGQGAAAVLVSEAGLAQALRRLQTLILSHPNPGLSRRLLGPLVLPLWALASWPDSPEMLRLEEDYRRPARNLLKIYLRIAFSGEHVLPIVQHLLFDGIRDPARPPSWRYQHNRPADGIAIVAAPDGQPTAADVIPARLSEVEPKCDVLLDLLEAISTDDDGISTVFLMLFRRRMVTPAGPARPAQGIRIKVEDEEDGKQEDPLAALLESSVLQRIMERFPETLARRPRDLLELVGGLLGQQDTAEATPVILSLLNLVVTAPGFRRAQVDAGLLRSIEAALETVSRQPVTANRAGDGDENEDNHDAKTAQNLLLFLRYHDELEAPDETAPTAAADSRRVEDRKTYSLALSYITQADAPPPVRSEGLVLLQGLVAAQSAVVDVPALLVLLSSLLDEGEDYVNLRVIQMLGQLADRHPRATTRELLEHYVDAPETRRVDTRLRFGEALLQVIQRLGETLTGEAAEQVGDALLAVASRRGRRPKTAARRAREEEKQKRKKELEARRGGVVGGEDEDEDEEDDDSDDSKEAKNAILATLAAWGGRGHEDERIRASALSILATAIETSIAGLGATRTSAAVDLSLHVLALEPEPGRAIVRRAAIVLLMSFIRALHSAREQHRRLGFGLTSASQEDIRRILQYVASTDEDGLVRQHATDVLESLDAWQLTEMLPEGGGTDDNPAALLGGGLGSRLAGLSVDAEARPAGQRPRIEEVE